MPTSHLPQTIPSIYSHASVSPLPTEHVYKNQVCLTLAFSLRDKFAGSFIAFGKRLSVDKLEHESRKARTFPQNIVRKRRSIFVLQWVKSFLELLVLIGRVREEKVFSQENCSSKLFSSQEETHGQKTTHCKTKKRGGTKQKGWSNTKRPHNARGKGTCKKTQGDDRRRFPRTSTRKCRCQKQSYECPARNLKQTGRELLNTTKVCVKTRICACPSRSPAKVAVKNRRTNIRGGSVDKNG